MRVANIFSLHLDLVPKRLFTTDDGLERDAAKPERRGTVRRTTILLLGVGWGGGGEK